MVDHSVRTKHDSLLWYMTVSDGQIQIMIWFESWLNRIWLDYK